MSLGRGRCVICTSMFFSHNIAALHCGHTFHFECVSKWVERSRTCPICRIRTSERQIIQHLYFDSADELDATQRQSSNVAQIEALAIALENEKNISLQAQEEIIKLKNSVASLQAKLDSEKKRVREKIPSLEARNRQLEMILVDQHELERALEKTKSRLRACEFYKAITTGKDETAIDRYVNDSGGVEVGQFLNILRKQLDEARKLQEKLTDELHMERNLVRTLKQKEYKLKNIVKVLHQELKDVRIASHMDSATPFNRKLSNLVLEQSPPKRESLGFNESVDLDANVLNSALRHGANREPVFKNAHTKRVHQELFFNISDDEKDFGLSTAGSSVHFTVTDSMGLPPADSSVHCAVTTDSMSNPQVPKSMRDRVLKCSKNTRSTGLGGAQGPADMALANLELRRFLPDEAPKKSSLLKRKNIANDAKNQRLSQFFTKKGRTVDVVDLD